MGIKRFQRRHSMCNYIEIQRASLFICSKLFLCLHVPVLLIPSKALTVLIFIKFSPNRICWEHNQGHWVLPVIIFFIIFDIVLREFLIFFSSLPSWSLSHACCTYNNGTYFPLQPPAFSYYNNLRSSASGSQLVLQTLRWHLDVSSLLLHA